MYQNYSAGADLKCDMFPQIYLL